MVYLGSFVCNLFRQGSKQVASYADSDVHYAAPLTARLVVKTVDGTVIPFAAVAAM